MSKPAEVICVGAALADIPLCPVSRDIFNVESYPLQQIRMTIGGDAINEATIIRRLGHTTALVTLLGDDAVGRYVLDFCRQNDIITDAVRVDATVDTSINVGLVTDDGERTFVTNRNGSLWKMTADCVNTDAFHGARLLSLASVFNNPLLDNSALVRIFQAAKREGLVICADTIKPRGNERLADVREALSYVDYFFPNFSEAQLLTGEGSLDAIAEALLGCGVRTVVIKNGSKGCYLRDRDGAAEIPAYGGIRALDTIGAGDNFVSGFISGLLEGRSLTDCARLANATAAISVTAIGATTGVTSRSQVNDMLQRYLAQQSERMDEAR